MVTGHPSQPDDAISVLGGGSPEWSKEQTQGRTKRTGTSGSHIYDRVSFPRPRDFSAATHPVRDRRDKGRACQRRSGTLAHRHTAGLPPPRRIIGVADDQ